MKWNKIRNVGAMAESADATDLKSVDGDILRVRPPLAPLEELIIKNIVGYGLFIIFDKRH